MTKIIGLTGGIGSGKSTIAGFFEEAGIPVYIADDEAKKIMNQPEVMQEIQSIFEDNVIENAQLNRKKIAQLVFSKPQKLEELNQIIHPKVKKHFLDWIEKHSDSPFVIKEAAILFESGTYKDCDKIILVTAPEAIRIQRVINRDKVSENEILERISNQWEEEKKVALADFVIQNIDLEESKRKTKDILKVLNKM
jgi:dephospho-CoA kinase